MPPTIVTQRVESIRSFIKEHLDVVTKPLYGNGGEGIFRSKLEDLTLEGIDETKDISFFFTPILTFRKRKSIY